MSEDLGRGRQGPEPPGGSSGLPGRAPDATAGRPVDQRDPAPTRPTAPAPDPRRTAPTVDPTAPGTGPPGPTTLLGLAPDPPPTPAPGSDGWAPPSADQSLPPAAGTGWAAPTGPTVGPAPHPPAGPAAGAPTAAASMAGLGRPGGIPLRPLDVGDILDSTFGTIRRNPRTVIGLSAVLVTLQQLLAVAAEVGTGDIPTVYGAFSDRASLQVVGGVGAVLSLVVSSVVGAVLTGMIVLVVAEDVFGRRLGVGDVWERVRPRLWALIAASLLAGVLPFVGLLFLLLPAGVPLTMISLAVPGALLWGALALTTPALILERLGPIRALRRSCRLSFPAFWRVWGIRALSVLLGWVMQSLLLIPFTALGVLLATLLGANADDPPLVALACVVLGSILGGMIAQPFLAGVLALLYVDRRMRAEGLDIVIQQQARAAQRTGSAASRAAQLPTATVAATGSGP